MKIKASKKIVVVKPKKLADISLTSGLVAVSEKVPEIGEIVEIGSGKVPVEMKVGDIVAYRKYGESQFFIGGMEFLFIGFDDILGVLETEK